MNTNKAAVWKKPGLIQIENREYPSLCPTDVLVKIKYVGLCGSDLHFFTDGRIGSGVLTGPRVFGHEASGEVAAAGSRVTHLKPGDKVVLDPGQSCGQCAYCQTGRYNLCDRAAWDFLGTSKKYGALQQYFPHPADRVYRLPDAMSLKTGALLEPFSVASHGVRRMGIQGGGDTLIIGCGCIGLMTLLSVKSRFNTRVIVADVVQKRLDKALELGADAVINSGTCDLVQQVMELTGQKGADYIYETAGVPFTVCRTADCAKKGGKIVFVGTTVDTHVKMHFNAIMRKELDMATVFRYAGEMRMAIDTSESFPCRLEDIVTHEYAFEDVQEAFVNNIEHKDHVVKTLIRF